MLNIQCCDSIFNNVSLKLVLWSRSLVGLTASLVRMCLAAADTSSPCPKGQLCITWRAVTTWPKRGGLPRISPYNAPLYHCKLKSRSCGDQGQSPHDLRSWKPRLPRDGHGPALCLLAARQGPAASALLCSRHQILSHRSVGRDLLKNASMSRVNGPPAHQAN